MAAQGTTHVLRIGESLESLAYERGLYWPSVWDLEENKALRELREDPHVLAPGDSLFLPDRAAKTVTAAAGRRHVFRRRAIPARLRLIALADGQVQSEIPFAVDIDGKVVEGTAGPDGLIEQWILPNAQRVRVRIGLGFDQRVFEVDVRELQPVATIAGVQARLHNFGYPTAVDGALTYRTQDALRRFQAAHALPVTGEADDATREKLRELYTQ